MDLSEFVFFCDGFDFLFGRVCEVIIFYFLSETLLTVILVLIIFFERILELFEMDPMQFLF